MICPKCGADALVVVDSRSQASEVNRRRKCCACEYRFNTIEMPVETYREIKRKMLERVASVMQGRSGDQ